MSEDNTFEMTEAFFQFMIERENIRLRKEAGLPWPWTNDDILRTFKFTNVHRHHDRTSKLLIDRYYRTHRDDDPKLIVLNAGIFRYFGTIEFADAIGWQSSWAPKHLIRVANKRLERGDKVFTNAYIVTNAGRPGPKVEIVVNSFLASLWANVDEIVKLITFDYRWFPVIDYLVANVNGYKSFMAKELILDTRYTNLWPPEGPIDKNEFTPVGPGAQRGAGWILGDTDNKKVSMTETEFICKALFDEYPLYWPHQFERLELHDIQFQLCEFSKYMKVKTGIGKPKSRYVHREKEVA